jgi:hypothetical protein
MTVPYIAKATPKTPIWFPAKYPIESRRFSLDVSEMLNLTTNGRIVAVNAAAAPSGTGELALSNLSATASGYTLRLTLDDGQPTRVYSIAFTVGMSDGEIFEFVAFQGIPPGLPGYPTPYPPVPDFGDPVTWSAATGLGRYDISTYDSGVVYGSRDLVAGVYNETNYDQSLYT